MIEHNFTLILDRDPSAAAEILEATCDDAVIGRTNGVWFAEFDREADTFREALDSAIVDIRAAGLDLVRVEPDDYVTAAEIAERSGRSRESVRLLALGKRGAGDFPPPASHSLAPARLWRWSDVAAWMNLESASDAQLVAALNARLDLTHRSARLDDASRATLERVTAPTA